MQPHLMLGYPLAHCRQDALLAEAACDAIRERRPTRFSAGGFRVATRPARRTGLAIRTSLMHAAGARRVSYR